MKNLILKNDMEQIINAELPWEAFSNKSILVSGANGFLPAYMVETLLYLNDKRGLNIQVIGLVRNKRKAETRFKDHINRDDFHILTQDVTQPFWIDDNIDFIIHAASQASPKYFGADPVGTLAANVLGTSHLLELAKIKKSQAFLYFSSAEVYGEASENQAALSETSYGYLDPLKLRSCYAESKRMGENMCISYAHQFGVPVKIIRPFHVYGPGLQLDDGRVFADFVADIVQKNDICLHSKGSSIRAFCYLADATLGFFTVLLKGDNANAYNIGNPTCTLSIKELADTLVALFPEQHLKVTINEARTEASYLESKVTVSCPDISKARALGWQPLTSIKDGFRKTVESFYEFV